MIKRRLPKHCVEDKGPDKKIRIYLRRPGHKKIRLLSPVPWSEPFMEEYRAALADTGGEVTSTVKPRASKGTFSWLCEQYYTSAEYKRLDQRTARVRKQILNKVCAEPIKPGSTILTGKVPIGAITTKAIRVLRDRISETPEAANDRVKAIRQVFAIGVASENCETNPARDVPYLESNNPDGFHTWTLEEVEKFEDCHEVGSRARLALALMLYTSQRRSDAVLLGPSHIKVRPDPDDPKKTKKWLDFTQFKNRRRKPVHMSIPMRPELEEIIKQTPCGDMTFLITEFGLPFTANGFGNWFRDRCVEAGVPGRAHGLRKAAASRLAELGASDREIMAITGHATPKEITRYTKKAQQMILAGNAMKRHAKGGT